MKIYFDNIIFSLQKAGGISVVWQNLIKNLLSHNPDIKFIEYPNARENLFRKALNIQSKNIVVKHFNKLFAQLHCPKIIQNDKFIFHSSYFRTCNNPNAINITTVHDFIYEQGTPNLKQKLRIWLNYRAIRNSDAIVCISENTKQDLLKYLPDTPSEKIHVIYNGVSNDYFKLSESPYPEYSKHILFVGGRQGYKNFEFTVKALKRTKYKLLICGAPLNDYEKLILDQNLTERYICITYPTNTELNKIYNSVYCLLYPSSYEGFGLPILEAQRAGCPVIALNASSIPEIIGNDTLLMSELTEYSLKQILGKLENAGIRKQVINRGIKNASNFSWEKMSNEYLNLYSDLLNQ